MPKQTLADRLAAIAASRTLRYVQVFMLKHHKLGATSSERADLTVPRVEPGDSASRVYGGKHAYRKRWKKYARPLSSTLSPTERARAIMRTKTALLGRALAAAKKTSVALDTLPVLVCPEDYWDDNSELTPDAAIPQDIVFSVFRTDVAALSKQYPEFLILPGSVTASAPADARDPTVYKQENSKYSIANKKLKTYMQNCAPVFYGGVWLRYNCKAEYGEDYLDGQVFMGRRDFPFAPAEQRFAGRTVEEAVEPWRAAPARTVAAPDLFDSHVFTVHGYRIAEEICRDHREVDLSGYDAYDVETKPLHVHVVVSETVARNEDNLHLKEGGCFVHCDGSKAQRPEDMVMNIEDGEARGATEVREVDLVAPGVGLRLLVFPRISMPAK